VTQSKTEPKNSQSQNQAKPLPLLIGMKPMLTAEQLEWVDSLEPSFQRTVEELIERYGQEYILKHWTWMKNDFAYAENF